MGYYLMVKRPAGHRIKYLCKCGDYKDHIKYQGSGVYWRKILNKIERDEGEVEIVTEVLGYYESKEELREAGQHYSDLWNVADNPAWANCMPEVGDGGPNTVGWVKAHKNGKQKMFPTLDDIPEGWTPGAPKWKKNPEGVEKTRLAHLGKKRPESTRQKMREAVRKPRLTIPCQYCRIAVTKQNLKRHEQACKEKK